MECVEVALHSYSVLRAWETRQDSPFTRKPQLPRSLLTSVIEEPSRVNPKSFAALPILPRFH